MCSVNKILTLFGSGFLIERIGIKYSFQNFPNITRDKNIPIYKTEKITKLLQLKSRVLYNSEPIISGSLSWDKESLSHPCP